MFAQRRALPLPDWNAPRDPENPMWRLRAARIAESSETGPFTWEQWAVPRSEEDLERISPRRNRGLRDRPRDRSADWKAWFAERGVKWPAGSRLRHLARSSDILVRATPADHRRIRDLVAELEANPFDPAPPPPPSTSPKRRGRWTVADAPAAKELAARLVRHHVSLLELRNATLAQLADACAKEAAREGSEGPVAFRVAPAAAELPVRLTFKMGGTDLRALLETCAVNHGFDVRVGPDGIVFLPPSGASLAAPDAGGGDEPWPECSHWPAGDRPLPDRDDEPSGAPFDPDSPDTIVHRQYSIRPSNRPGGLSASDNAEKWHDWFAEKGVAWPAGSSVSFFPTLGKLVVANTRKNLDRVEALLKSAAKPSPGP